MYGVEVSPALIFAGDRQRVRKMKVKAWQDRPLEVLYPIVYLDALMVKMRPRMAGVENRAAYTAIGINVEAEIGTGAVGQRPNEGAKFWGMSVLMNLKNAG